MRLNLTWSPSITKMPRQQRRPLASSTPLSLSLSLNQFLVNSALSLSQPMPRQLRSLSLSQPMPRQLRSLSVSLPQLIPRQLRFLC